MKTLNVMSLDFTYNPDKDIPQISLSNLNKDNPAEQNSLGQYVPIYASVSDDKEGIDRDSVSLNITGAGIDVDIPASDFNAPGDGLYTSFLFDLSGDTTLKPGEYNGALTAADKKGVSNTIYFSFLLNKGAPSILSVDPDSTYAGVNADDEIVLQVETSDDNH